METSPSVSVHVCHLQPANGVGDRESTHTLLSPVDLIQYFWYTPYCWFYSKCPSLETLQSSLIKILPLYPELCSIKKDVISSLRLDHGDYEEEEGMVSYFVEIEHQPLSSCEGELFHPLSSSFLYRYLSSSPFVVHFVTLPFALSLIRWFYL
jgi:hypothetical protein